MPVSVLGAAAALLMLVAELSTVASVELPGGSCAQELELATPAERDRCELSGLERHGGALILLAILTVVMAWGASLGGSRPAAAALILIGAVVLGVGLLLDLPETDETGAIGRNFEGATASAGAGLYLELAAGALAIATGALRLTRQE